MRKILIFLFVATLLVTTQALAKNETPEASRPKEENFVSVEERRLNEALNKEKLRFEEHMKQREESLNNKEVALNLLEKEVEKKIKLMENLKKEVSSLFENKNSEAAQRSSELAKMYEKMEPEEAAGIIKDLKKGLTVSILLKMNKKSAGQILAAMNPKTASKLSTSYSMFFEQQEKNKRKR